MGNDENKNQIEIDEENCKDKIEDNIKNAKLKSKHILYYYVFQKQIYKYLKDWNSLNDSYSIRSGFFINIEWIEEWKRRINYNYIKKSYLDYFNIESLELNK